MLGLPRLFVVCLLVLIAAASDGRAQTWAGNSASPLWSNASNWSSAPAGGPQIGSFTGGGSSVVWADQTYTSTARVSGGTYTIDRLGSLQGVLDIDLRPIGPGDPAPVSVTLTNGAFKGLLVQNVEDASRTVYLTSTARLQTLGSYATVRVSSAGVISGGSLALGNGTTESRQVTQFDQTGGQTTLTGSLTVGSTSATPLGTALVTVSDGVFSVGTTTTVQTVGSSRLTVDGGTFRTGSLTANGRLTHTNGRLEIVGGTFTPTTAAAAYVVNGGLNADNPTLAFFGPTAAFTNVTTLTVGSTKRGAFEVLAGANLTFDAIDIGSTATGAGSVLVSGAGSRLTGTNGLAVGGTSAAAGGIGTLTVGPGGTATTPGTLSLWAGGTLNLNGGKVKAASIAANGGAVNFVSGEVRLTSIATIDAALGTALFGTARELSAGRTLSGNDLTVGTNIDVTGGALTSNGSLTNAGTLRVSAGLAQGNTVVNQAGRTITVSGTGELVATIGMSNAGTLLLADNQVAVGGGTLTNSGTIRGTGLVNAPLSNGVSGQVQVTSGGRLQFNGATNSNAGVVSVIGGEAQFTGGFTNAAGTGLVTARDAILRFDGGLTNNGSLAVSTGVSDVFGNVANASTGRISVSGGGTATFYGDVAHNGSNSIQVSAGSRAVFFGGVSGTGSFSGAGTVFLEGDLRPGASPGLMTFGGDVVFGQGSRYVMEIGGATRGAEYDALDVTGNLDLGGTLEVQLINGFTPFAGQRFVAAIFGSRFGDFANYFGMFTGGGVFQAGFEGGQLVLTFNPVPEPGLLLAAAGAVALVLLRAGGRLRSKRRFLAG